MNQTKEPIQEFIIVGFPGFQDKNSRSMLFCVLLTVYILILLANALIVITIMCDESLQSPMYILFYCLAVIDTFISTTTVPKLLEVLSSSRSSISITACFVQMFSYHTFSNAESILLGLMAYDRYLAICRPLHYYTNTSNSLVIKQIICCWICAVMILIVPIILVIRLQFCDQNKLVHFFCDYSAVLKLACSDTLLISYVGLGFGLSALVIPLIYILYSYSRIIHSVLKITKVDGRLKAFSTCSTHLMIISVFYIVGAGVFISNRIPGTSIDMRIMIGLVQNLFPPVMNPIIYCLRSKEIRESFVKTLKKNRIFPKRN
ncbi:OR3A1 protein, partial [Polypterus senegalus]|nr:OR3A1 protein [Polypterus senegalus]